MVEEKNKKNFKKHSIVLVFFQVIFIALLVLLNNFRSTEIGIPNFSMEKLFMVSLKLIIMFGIFVLGYLLAGLFKYKIANTNFVKKINYRALMVILFIMMIIGVGCFFVNLYLVGGELSLLTWGSFILGMTGLIMLGITLFIGVFLIIDEVKISI